MLFKENQNDTHKIKHHEWFYHIDYDRLKRGNIQAPFSRRHKRGIVTTVPIEFNHSKRRVGKSSVKPNRNLRTTR